MSKVYFDVGANDGSSSLHLNNLPNSTVYLFEPNPEMIRAITQHIASHNNKNFIIVPKAVSDYEGKATFNVCVTHDRGCSSLLEVSEAGKTQWGGRIDMLPAASIEVDVIRLDKFIESQFIEEIEYFHCDTQGSDLKVLQGMGDHINKIKAGVVEAAAKPDILYNGQNTLSDTAAYLQSRGFEIIAVYSNDVQENEVNIHFRRKL
jgi:FkbM family methyltransferase